MFCIVDFADLTKTIPYSFCISFTIELFLLNVSVHFFLIFNIILLRNTIHPCSEIYIIYILLTDANAVIKKCSLIVEHDADLVAKRSSVP